MLAILLITALTPASHHASARPMPVAVQVEAELARLATLLDQMVIECGGPCADAMACYAERSAKDGDR